MTMNRWIAVLAAILAFIIIAFFIVPTENDAPQATANSEQPQGN